MSKSRYPWWGYALAMIREYPSLRSSLMDLREQNITADMSGMPGGGGASRTAENVALRQLPVAKQEEYEAVDTAYRRLNRSPQAKQRLAVVQKNICGGCTLLGVAGIAHISESTARLYRWDFIMWVGVAHGRITEDEYQHERKKKLKNSKVCSPAPK